MSEGFPMVLLLCLASLCGQSTGPVEIESSMELTSPGVCEVHGAQMIREKVMAVPITVEYEIAYQQAMQSQFPNQGLAFASDYPGLDSVWVEYCPECREANRLWIEEN